MLVTKMTKNVTNISKVSPTHFVSNIRHQHRCNFQYSTSVKLNWKSSVFELMLAFLQTTFSNINIYLKTYISYWFSFWVAKPRPYTPKCRHRCYSVRSFPWIRQTELKTNGCRSRPVSLLRNIQGKPMFWLATFITCIKKISVSYFS